MRHPLLTILASAFILVPASLASAQSSPPVVGYYKLHVPAGNTAWTAGFVTKDAVNARATSLTSGPVQSVLTQAGAGWSAGAFAAHYVEFLDDPATSEVEPWAGLVLDIVGNTANTLTVLGSTAAFPGLGTTPRYAVRKHATLGTLFPGGAGLSPYNDVVTLYDSEGSLIQSVYDGAGNFVNTLDFVTPTTDTIVYPGQGFVLTAAVATTIRVGGGEVSFVKSGPTKVPVYAGQFNLIGPVTPLVATDPADPLYPSSITLAQAGVLHSRLSVYGDLVTLFASDGSISTTGVYTTDGVSVIDTIDFATNANSTPFQLGRAFSVTPDADKYFNALAPQN